MVQSRGRGVDPVLRRAYRPGPEPIEVLAAKRLPCCHASRAHARRAHGHDFASLLPHGLGARCPVLVQLNFSLKHGHRLHA